MSIEYSGEFSKEINDEMGQVVLDDLAALRELEVIDRNGPSMSLRFVAYPKRDKWPEDVSVKISPASLYVAIHSAHGEDRANFICKVSQVLAAHGILAVVEEI